MSPVIIRIQPQMEVLLILQVHNNINIVVDCRNKCIDFNVTMDEVVIEDDTFRKVGKYT
jgi:hypothetical protein